MLLRLALSNYTKLLMCRDGIFNQAWNALFKMRWPELANSLKPHDWHEVYWETHLQK